MQPDIQKAILAAAGRYVRKLLEPIDDRIKSLESRTFEKGDKGDKGDAGEPGPQGLPGRDGRDGLPGVQGEKGLDGINGKDGADGKDGLDGVDGTDGKDGLGFDDLDVVHDGARGFTFKFAKGDRVKEFSFSLPVVLDAGFWKDGTQAKAGDGMTCGGSYWIALEDTAEKPDTSSKAWRLAVKKGRDLR